MADFKRMRNSVLRSVRERMVSGNYDEITKLNSIKTVSDIVVIAGKRLSAEDIFGYYETVAAIQDDDVRTLGAVGELVDGDVYESFGEEDRERYVLTLSAFYKKLKAEVNERAAKARERGASAQAEKASAVSGKEK